MRSTTAGEDTVLAANSRNHHLRVKVANADGNLQNLASLGGVNWINGVEWSQTVDQPVQAATVRLRRDTQGYAASLAPLATGSSLNVDNTGAYASLLDPSRRIWIEVATTAVGASPAESDYKLLFDGEIDEVDWAAPEVIVYARDRIMSKLADRWVEVETVYGSDEGVDISSVMQEILTDWADGEILTTDGTPAFRVVTYEQQKMSVLDALTTLAQLIGWDIKSRWNGAQFGLEFYEPSRSSPSVDYTFTQTDILGVRRLEVNRANIRNVVSVIFTPEDGTERTKQKVTATASVARFGRRWMEIEEASDSSINTAAKATQFANAALNDLQDPTAEQEVETHFFWPLELGDYYTFDAGDTTWYSTDQSLGVYGFRHEISGGGERTHILLRGKPAGQYLAWHLHDRVRNDRDLDDIETENRLLNFRRQIDTANQQVTFLWDWGDVVEQAWIYDEAATQPEATDVFASFLSRAPDTVLDRASNPTPSYTATIPVAGTTRFLQFEPRSASMESGPVYRTALDPQPVDEPDGAVIGNFNTAGQLRAGAVGNSLTASWRIAGAMDSPPAATTVRAQAAINGRSLTATQIGVLATATGSGQVGYVRAFAYSATGAAGSESQQIDDQVVYGIGVTAIPDGSIIANKLIASSRHFGSDLVFSASDFNTVAWVGPTGGSGSIVTHGGTSYTVAGGNTGNMLGLSYIYHTTTATGTLQTATDIATTQGDGKILLAVAKPASATDQDAFYVPAVGVLGLNADNISVNSVSADKIQANAITSVKINAAAITSIKIDANVITASHVVANAITASHVLAGEITATHINVSQIDAISANLGQITAGQIQNTASNAGIWLSTTATEVPAAWSRYLNLSATKGDFLSHSNLSLGFDGSADFGGDVSSSNLTATAVSVAGVVTANKGIKCVAAPAAFASVGAMQSISRGVAPETWSRVRMASKSRGGSVAVRYAPSATGGGAWRTALEAAYSTSAATVKMGFFGVAAATQPVLTTGASAGQVVTALKAIGILG